ncbi:MAG: hypothetical protein EBU97_05600 [Rhodobacteraceae bacterium]|nr:hypothetical protein [Paracoccaceae bacterium]
MPALVALRRQAFTLAVTLTLCSGLAAPAAADCYVDYKAKADTRSKTDAPLRLHYGVAQVTDDACNGDKGAARDELSARLSADGWKLLNIVSAFGPDGLDQRRDSAGPFFLRY